MVSKLAFTPMRLGPLALKNRFVKAATFEGVMPRGRVSDALIDFHTEVARGGAAMTTVAYCAISPGGRVHRDTVVLDRDHIPQLRRLTDAVHSAGALVCAQLGHAGLVANTLSNRTPTLAPSTRVSAPAMGLVRAATPEQLDAVVDGFGSAARNAVDAGFDALEIHMGHGYLLSSFFSPNLNRRSDHYGGDTVRRAELARRVAERVRLTVGINRLDTVEDALAEGFQFVAMARALLRDPYLVKRFREGGAVEGLCIHCMKCMPTVYTGTHCVVRTQIEAVSAG